VERNDLGKLARASVARIIPGAGSYAMKWWSADARDRVVPTVMGCAILFALSPLAWPALAWCGKRHSIDIILALPIGICVINIISQALYEKCIRMHFKDQGAPRQPAGRGVLALVIAPLAGCMLAVLAFWAVLHCFWS
jgi:hypothetical protein